MPTKRALIKVEDWFDGQVIRIVLNEPPGNLLGTQMLAALSREVKRCGMRSEVKLLIFEGAGENFSYGARIEELVKEKVSGFLRQVTALFYTMIEFNIPTMAVVRGHCLGTGLELAIFSDFVFASDTAVFGFPEVTLGICPAVGSILLPARVGQSAATRLVLSGERLNAKEAKERQLVHEAVPAAKLDAAVRRFVETTILPKSAVALRMSRRVTRRMFHGLLRKELANVEKEYMERLMVTRDANEGIAAFLEKRPPKWRNR